MEIPERDWKKLRGIRENLLNRLCAGILVELKSRLEVEDLSVEAHQKYLGVYKFIKQSDQRVGRLFNDWRRSTVLGILYQWVQEGIMTEAEFEALSETTKDLIHRMTPAPKFYLE